MERTLRFFMLLAAVLLCSPSALFGSVKVGDVYYDLDATNKSANVTGGDPLATEIVIPARISSGGDTYDVTGMANSAFKSYENLESVEIPGSIATLGANAFEGCSNLKNVRFGLGTKTISAYSFCECPALTEVTLPSSVISIADYAFQNCTGMKTLNLNEGLTTIGKRTFQGCRSLEELSIPNSVTKLDDWAFEYCGGLKKVVLGKNTNHLGCRVFGSADSLEEITFNCKPTYNNDSFYRCSGISRIYLDDMSLSDWLTISWSKSAPTTGGHANEIYYDGKPIVDLVIPDDVTKIENNVFRNCQSLKTVRIPAHVVEIPSDVFRYTKLNSFIIEDSETPIAVYEMFRYMDADTIHLGRNFNPITYQITSAVKVITFGDNYQTLNAYLLRNCNKLERLDLSKIKVIEIEAVRNCGVLSEVIIGNPTLIDTDAFKDCTIDRLKSYAVTPPAAAETAFSDMTFKCAKLEVPEGAKSAYAAADVWKNFVRVVEPDVQMIDVEVTLSSAGTLMNRISLNDIERIRSLKLSGYINGTDILLINKMINMESLDLSGANIKSGGMPYYQDDKTSAVTRDDELNRYWAYGLSYLRELKLPATLKSVGEYGCENLPFLKSILIPASINSVGRYAFNNAMSLDELIIEDSDRAISFGSGSDSNVLNVSNLYLGRSLISGIKFTASLKTLTVSPYVTDIPWLVFGDRASTTYVSNLERIDISDLETWCKISFSSVASNPIWSGAKFYLNGQLIEHLDFPSTLGEVKANSFAGCLQLKSVYIPSSVKTIGTDAFRSCQNMESAILPSSVTSICNGAFSTSGLKSIRLPYSIENIESSVFYNCQNLTEISIPASVKKVGENAFVGCTNLKKVTVANQIPPTMNDKSFDDSAFTDIPLYIPKESAFIYYLHPFWSKFRTREELGGGYFVPKPILFSIDETNGNEAIITASTDVKGDVVIPATVEQDGKTYTVTSITPESFKDNTEITSIVIPETVKYIGYDSFSGCANLTEVTLGAATPESRSISTYANGDSEEAPDATVIGENAFAGCTGIKSVKANWQIPPRAPESAFASEVYANAVLDVRFDVLDDYRNSEYCWSKFANAVSGIDDITADSADKTPFIIENGTISFDAAATSEGIEIYNIAGALIYAGADASVKLERGVYIVKIGDKATKVAI